MSNIRSTSCNCIITYHINVMYKKFYGIRFAFELPLRLFVANNSIFHIYKYLMKEISIYIYTFVYQQVTYNRRSCSGSRRTMRRTWNRFSCQSHQYCMMCTCRGNLHINVCCVASLLGNSWVSGNTIVVIVTIVAFFTIVVVVV